jgi:hypothetical protein
MSRNLRRHRDGALDDLPPTSGSLSRDRRHLLDALPRLGGTPHPHPVFRSLSGPLQKCRFSVCSAAPRWRELEVIQKSVSLYQCDHRLRRKPNQHHLRQSLLCDIILHLLLNRQYGPAQVRCSDSPCDLRRHKGNSEAGILLRCSRRFHSPSSMPPCKHVFSPQRS